MWQTISSLPPPPPEEQDPLKLTKMSFVGFVFEDFSLKKLSGREGATLRGDGAG